MSDRETRKRKKADVVHPVFLRFIPLTLDDFWKEKVGDFARGKFPRCLSYRDGCLSYRKRSKVYTCHINEDAVEDTYLRFRRFMVDTVGMRSSTDIEAELREYEDSQKSVRESTRETWKDLDTAWAKDLAYDEYVTRMSSEHRLTPQERTTLRCLISLGLSLKCIRPATILYEDHKIKAIKPVVIAPGKSSEVPRVSLNMTYAKKKTVKKVKLSGETIWDVYMAGVISQANALRKMGKR